MSFNWRPLPFFRKSYEFLIIIIIIIIIIINNDAQSYFSSVYMILSHKITFREKSAN